MNDFEQVLNGIHGYWVRCKLTSYISVPATPLLLHACHQLALFSRYRTWGESFNERHSDQNFSNNLYSIIDHKVSVRTTISYKANES